MVNLEPVYTNSIPTMYLQLSFAKYRPLRWGLNVLVCVLPSENDRQLLMIWIAEVDVFIWPMMTSSKGNIFRVTDHLCGEFTGHRWSLRTKACNAEIWFFSLICAWINCGLNSLEAGDLRRYDQLHLNENVDILTKFSYWLHWRQLSV